MTEIDGRQKQVLENDLRARLNGALQGRIEQLGTGIADLKQRVQAVQDPGASSALRARLQSIEAEFNASANLLKGPVSFDDPKRLLEIQMQVYKLSENVEILSRTVSDAASGVKTILQTQV